LIDKASAVKTGNLARRIGSEAQTGWLRYIDTMTLPPRIEWRHKKTSVSCNDAHVFTFLALSPAKPWSNHVSRLALHRGPIRFESQAAVCSLTLLVLLEQITYGLYLSDHSILDGIDTELIVLSGMILQNLTATTAWHLRGKSSMEPSV
jgi:hypothetical protein